MNSLDKLPSPRDWNFYSVVESCEWRVIELSALYALLWCARLCRDHAETHSLVLFRVLVEPEDITMGDTAEAVPAELNGGRNMALKHAIFISL